MIYNIQITDNFDILFVLVPLFFAAFLWKEQDLKKRYNAKWALITGASSGHWTSIGSEICKIRSGNQPSKDLFFFQA